MAASDEQTPGPTREHIRGVVESYLALVADGKASEIADLYTADATVEDPVGTDLRRGRAAIEEFYAGLEGLEQETRLETLRIAGNEAVFCFEILTKAGESTYRLAPIDHMVFDEDGKVTAMRAFWDPATDMTVV